MKVLFLSRLYIHLSSKVMNIKNKEVMVYDFFQEKKERKRERAEKEKREQRE